MSDSRTSEPSVFRGRLEPLTTPPPWLLVAVGIPVLFLVVGSPVWFATDVGDITSSRRGGQRIVGIDSNVTNWGLAVPILAALAFGLIAFGLWELARAGRQRDIELVANADGVWVIEVEGADKGAHRAIALAHDRVTVQQRLHSLTITSGDQSLQTEHALHPADVPALTAAMQREGRFVGVSGTRKSRGGLMPREWRGMPRVAIGIVVALIAVGIWATKDLSEGFLDPEIDVDVEIDL